ncbi:MAG TPA: M28 family peptidase [Gemmatimonadales bacterium]|nr:M28 family peptidase [Gemmatimonadales bacterium]
MLLALLLIAAVQQSPVATAATCVGEPLPRAAVDGAQLMRDVQVLAADSMEGRELGRPGGARARRYLASRIRGLGLDSLGPLEQPFSAGRRGDTVVTGTNLVALVKGTVDQDHHLVVTAHYDHEGVRRGQVYNGADDNASGVAALLAIAEHLKRHPPRHSVLLVWFDGEERGLVGAHAFLRTSLVPRAAMAVNVNLDMVGRSDKRRLFAVGPLARPVLTSYVRAAACRTPIALMLGHDRGSPGREDWTNQSDQGAFDQVGIPFVYLGVEDHEDYHRPTDDADRLHPTFFAGAVQAAIALVEELDADLAPLRRTP